MSFILDALKKAESERSRASGPVLVEVRIAPPRRRLPAWAWVLGGVLLANLAVLAWLLLRKPATHEVAAATAVNAAAAPTAPASAPALTTSLPVASPPAASSSIASTSVASTSPPSLTAAPAASAPPAGIDNLPTRQELQAAGVALPPLTLNMHAYDATPALRYVLLNGVRLAEGEFTPDGIKVEAITERGVVLDARGRRFLLPIGG